MWIVKEKSTKKEKVIIIVSFIKLLKTKLKALSLPVMPLQTP